MGVLLFFSAVPDMAVPGMVQPARDGQATQGEFLYKGQAACLYLDYLDTSSGGTLAPVPGGYYSMLAVNSRAGLTVPPPGRPWSPGNAGAGGTFAPEVTFLPLPAVHGHYAGGGCVHCDPGLRDVPPPPRRTPGPAISLRPSLTQARAALEQQRNTTGWHERKAAPQPQAGPPAAPPAPPSPTVMQQVRASLEESRVAHGHYAPGGCKRCLSGGQEG